MAPDAVGILAAVSGFLADRGLNVVESHNFGDLESGKFFIRSVFDASDASEHLSEISEAFEPIADKFSMSWSIRARADLPKALILVSKADHCLNDLLYRHRRGRLGAQIEGIVSNHEDARWHAESHDLPFFHVPVTPDTKPVAEVRLRQIKTALKADFVVLARYMQVLSNELAAEWSGQCINIHHSFLPSFKGAQPYHQAHKRGVKLIGATAHYVTADLDEGPIIAQEVEVIDHRATPQSMIALGRDTEARVLARAVKAHAEGRIFLNGHKTVVFA